MADQNEESADSMLLKAAESPWSIPTIVNPAVRGEILLHMFKKWRSRSSREKLAILFIIFCIKKSTITALEKEITEVIEFIYIHTYIYRILYFFTYKNKLKDIRAIY